MLNMWMNCDYNNSRCCIRCTLIFQSTHNALAFQFVCFFWLCIRIYFFVCRWFDFVVVDGWISCSDDQKWFFFLFFRCVRCFIQFYSCSKMTVVHLLFVVVVAFFSLVPCQWKQSMLTHCVCLIQHTQTANRLNWWRLNCSISSRFFRLFFVYLFTFRLLF